MSSENALEIPHGDDDIHSFGVAAEAMELVVDVATARRLGLCNANGVIHHRRTKSRPDWKQYSTLLHGVIQSSITRMHCLACWRVSRASDSRGTWTTTTPQGCKPLRRPDARLGSTIFGEICVFGLAIRTQSSVGSQDPKRVAPCRRAGTLRKRPSDLSGHRPPGTIPVFMTMARSPSASHCH